MPEARLAIAQAIIAVCESPKSNAVLMAVERALADAEKGGFQSVPQHLRDTHYHGAEKLGSGEGYKYVHDYPGHFVRQEYRAFLITSPRARDMRTRCVRCAKRAASKIRQRIDKYFLHGVCDQKMTKGGEYYII